MVRLDYRDRAEGNKHPSNVQENTSMRLMEMMETIQDLRMEVNREIQTLKRTLSEMKMGL